MSSSVTVRPAKGVRGIGIVSIVAGIIMIIAGVVVWFIVSSTLSDEQITVSEDASMAAGQEVAGPFTAYAQADIINQHAMEASGGMTYAQLDQEDPTRDTVMNASFLRASLFTSVVAFGVCALVIGLGVMFILVGYAFSRLGGSSSAAVVSTPTGGPTSTSTA
ncbi:aromatic ring-opening dioxygenase LigA [Isoptericola haloaureus]|uniref:Aromatic ring-opening dioxygenase LigA n=1 Tax=Isoptericola haloaureus TaxID=1542902 RepID=A0ABU7Z8J2_9MICO